MNAIEIKSLCKSYKNFALDQVSFSLPSGCILGLIGENGAGKSTTIKCILNIINKDSGSITLLGEGSDRLTLIKEDIGVVLDEVGLPNYMTASEIGKVMMHSYKNWDGERFYYLLKKLNVPENKKFKEFSKGTKMKLGIIIAPSHNAKLLILDEATNGLDPVVRDEITDLFLDFTRDESHSILISSHIVSDLEKMCDYIAFMHQGRIILFEEKDRLYDEYGIIQTTKEQFSNINPDAVIGKRFTSYSAELMVKKSLITSDFDIKPVSIEELFVFMVRGGTI